MSLFARDQPGSSGGAAAPRDNGLLLEFKAGRMTADDNSITPVAGKGSVSIRNDNTGLMTWNWTAANGNTSAEPIILFPGEQEFRKCKSSSDARVYYLKFTTGRREFYWMQDSDATKYEELMKKANRVMSGQPADDGAPAPNNDEFSAIANALGGNVSAQEQAALLQMLGGAAATPAPRAPQPTTATPAVSQTPAAPPAVQRPANPDAPAARGAQGHMDQDAMQGVLQNLAREMHVSQATSLTDVLAPANVEPLLDDDATVQRLLAHLPEGNNVTAADLRDNIRSAQYAQALATFSAAVQSGDLSLQALGINAPQDGTAPSGVQGLCDAVQKQEKPDGDSEA